MAEEQTLEERLDTFDPDDPEALAGLEAALSTDEETGSQDPESTQDEIVDETAGAAAAEAAEAAEATKTEADAAAAEAAKAETETAEPGKEEDTQAAQATDAEPRKVVKTRDGLHEIPYTVLEDERAARSRAENALRDMQAKMEAMQRQAAGQTAQAGDQAALDSDTRITPEQLEEIADISPDIAKVIKVQNQQMQQMAQYLENQARMEEQRRVDDTMAAIQSVPELEQWRQDAIREDNPDKERFDTAVNIDHMLKESPAWRDKPMTERFAKVVELTKDFLGEDKATPAAPVDPGAPTKGEIETAAKAAVAEAGAPVPTSLSEIPGGTPVAAGTQEEAESASIHQLAEKFLGMSDEAINDYLAKIG